MLLRGEMAWRVRVCAVVLGAAVLSIGLAPAARASDARHYEKVSPADKGNGDIVGDGGTNVASQAGDAVTLSTRTPFGDTIGSGVSGQTQYVARRTADGWATHAITPQARPEEYQTFFGPTLFVSYSGDLRTAVVWGYDFPSVTGDLPLRVNIYAEDTATRALQPVTALQGGLPDPLPDPVAELGDPTNWGVSADARHVAFVSSAQYLPQAAPGVRNVYQWDDGVPSLAGVLPDGTVPPAGSDVLGTGTQFPQFYRASMSADGIRLVFTSPPTGPTRQLFMRIGGTRTARISETELDPSDPNYNPTPRQVRLKAVTPDGRNVFFTTSTPLLSDGPGLYRYTDSADPSSDDNLTLIGPLDSSGQVVGVSDDGQRVYYQTSGNELVAWDHGATHVISTGVPIPGNEREQLAVESWGPGLGRLTPDGRFFAFASSVSDNGIGPTGEVTNGHREMYLYNLGNDTLRCISCPSVPATSDVTVKPEVTGGVPSYTMAGIRPRFLSDDGKVFFSTAEALVSQDRNGVVDAYEYDPATNSVSLISTGKGSDPTTFTDASASGNDVFLVTRQRLVRSDHDDLVDLYDARIGDSLPEPAEEATTPSCEGESCQAPPSASPPEDLLGSLTFDEGGAGVLGSVRLSVRKRLVVHGATGSLGVTLSAPGKLTWSGRGLQAGSVRRSRAGTYQLRLRLGRAARRQLNVSGSYTTSLRLRFVSASGDEAGKTTRVTFRAAAKKGR